MLRFFYGFCLLSLGFLSCRSENGSNNEVVADQLTQTQMLQSEQPIVKLNKGSEKVVADWTEYQNFREAVEAYQSISMSDALLNSEELAQLSQQLKDSIRSDKIDKPEVRIRLNVLHNESLRLSDMAKIPTITEDEVLQANNNVITAFSALNLKLNNMNQKENLNSTISSFVDEVIENADTTLRLKPNKLKAKDSLDKKIDLMVKDVIPRSDSTKQESEPKF